MTTKPAHASPSVQLASQRRSLVTRAQQSLSVLADQEQTELQRALEACRAVRDAKTRAQRAWAVVLCCEVADEVGDGR